MYRLPSLLAALLLLCKAPMAPATVADLPDKVAEALAANAASADPITIRWTRKRESRLRVDALLQQLKLPARMQNLLEPQECEVSFSGGRLYAWRYGKGVQRTEQGDFVSLVLEEIEVASDLSNLYVGSGREVAKDPRSQHLAVSSMEDTKRKTPDGLIFDVEFLFEAGLRFPRTAKEQGSLPRSTVLSLMDKGARLSSTRHEQWHGAACIRVELEAVDRVYVFYLDPALGYAVRGREELTREGKVILRSLASRFARVGSSRLWLPQRIEVSFHSWPTMGGECRPDPLFMQSFDVVAINNAPPPVELFTLTNVYNKPGITIGDARLLDAATSKALGIEFLEYRVPANPEDLENVVRQAREQALRKHGSKAFRWFWIWFLVVNLAIAAIFITWLRRLSRRARQ
jgi:hypothetical protein